MMVNAVTEEPHSNAAVFLASKEKDASIKVGI